MIGGKIDFDRIRWDLNDIDINNNHKYNYLRHKRWMMKIEKANIYKGVRQLLFMTVNKIINIKNYYFCPICKDRLLVDKKRESFFCIRCGFSHNNKKE